MPVCYRPVTARLLSFFLLLAAALFTGCGGGGDGPSIIVPGPGNPPPPTSVTATFQRAFPNLSFAEPVAMLQAPGDSSRFFVVEKRGRVQTFVNDDAATTTSLFLDLQAAVSSAEPEAGLLDIAFHPDFATNGEVFVSYTAPGSPLESRISRLFSFDGGQTLDSASEQILLTVLQPFTNHNGGQIHFGPGGNLFISFGDGGSGGDPQDNAQNPRKLLGKLLRIDVDAGSPYGIPTGNPNAGNALCTQGVGGAACPEIFATGFRNPWRFSIDTDTGAIWVGDVGQSSQEEIARVSVGENHGWKIQEGSACYSPASGCDRTGLTQPIVSYGRSAGISVTGGFVYRGSAVPDLAGNYVFGDYGSGTVWWLESNAAAGSALNILFETGFNIPAFARDNDGELYVIQFGGGLLHRIVAN